MTLLSKTVNGAIWNSIEVFGGKLIQLIITLILARILSPEDFGIIGLLVIFSELSKVIIDSGFSQALIRSENVSDNDYSSIFFLNTTIGLLVYTVIYFLAPVISSFYDYPPLTSITRILFISVIFNSLSVVQNAKLTKEINFKVLANRTIISNIISGIIAIYLAHQGYGVWSIVWQFVLSSMLRTILIWGTSKWLPLLVFELKSIAKYFKFGRNLLVSGILDVLVSNIQLLLIGKFYTKVDLGFYSQAKNLSSVPSQNITSIFRNVSYPALSRLNNDKKELKHGYIRTIKLAVFFVLPLMLFLAGASKNVVMVVLGQKWLPAYPLFLILCLSGTLFPLYSISQNVLLVKGKGEIYLKVSVIKRFISLILIIITVGFGVKAIVFGYLIATLLNTFILLFYAGREINYSLKEQFNDLISTIVPSLIMLAGVVAVNFIFRDFSPIFTLFIQTLIGGILYLLFAAIFKNTALNELKLMIRKKK